MKLKNLLIGLVAGASLALSGVAYAGGPVIEGEEPPLVAGDRFEKKPNIVPFLIAAGIIAIIASSGGGDGPTETCYGDPDPVDPGC